MNFWVSFVIKVIILLAFSVGVTLQAQAEVLSFIPLSLIVFAWLWSALTDYETS